MTKSRLSTLLAATLMAGGMVMGAGPAHATPGVVFTGTDSLGFACNTANPGVGLNGFVSCSPTQLVWRDVAPVGPSGEPTSELNILGVSNTPVPIISGGAWFDIAEIQHINTVIPGGVFNFTIIANDAFDLNHGANDVLNLPNIPLNVSFTETPNTAPCANPLGNDCADIFVVNNLDLVINSFLFNYDAGFGLETWEISFQVLADANTGTEFDPNNPAGGGTIYTAETNNSRLRIQAQINQVPEPGSLALLGIGLAGLPLFARRAKKADAKKA